MTNFRANSKSFFLSIVWIPPEGLVSQHDKLINRYHTPSQSYNLLMRVSGHYTVKGPYKEWQTDNWSELIEETVHLWQVIKVDY
jgi:hypothetical protein